MAAVSESNLNVAASDLISIFGDILSTIADVNIFFIAVNILWAAQTIGESILPSEGSSSGANAILPRLDNRLLLTATKDSLHSTTISNALALRLPSSENSQLIVASHTPNIEAYQAPHPGEGATSAKTREALDKIRKMVSKHQQWVARDPDARRHCWYAESARWDLSRFVDKFLKYWPGSVLIEDTPEYKRWATLCRQYCGFYANRKRKDIFQQLCGNIRESQQEFHRTSYRPSDFGVRTGAAAGDDRHHYRESNFTPRSSTDTERHPQPSGMYTASPQSDHYRNRY